MPAALRLPWLLLALAACGPPPAPAASRPGPTPERPPAPATSPAPATAAAEAKAPARRIPLRFDINGLPFPSPLADAMVGGLPAMLLVDTGATGHVIASWLAEEAALPLLAAGDVVLDQVGRPVPVSRVEDAELTLSGWGPIELPMLLVLPIPDAMRRAGIGGILSPHALAADDRAVVLDLRAGAMTEAPLAEAVRALAAEEGPGALIDLSICAAAPRPGLPQQPSLPPDDGGRQFLARASVAGIDVTLKIDTGASDSSLFAATAAGQRLESGAQGKRSSYAATGKHTVPVLEDANVLLGGLHFAADVAILPGAPRPGCSMDGYLGMDVLRSCVLVLGKARGAARCTQA